MRPRFLALSAVACAFVFVAVVFAVVRGDDTSELQNLIALGQPIYCGGGKGPYVALTFDDGPTRYTPQLLSVLRADGARATFFEIGRKAASNPDFVRRELAAGALGDHSWSHPTLTDLGAAAIDREVRKAKSTIESVSGSLVLLFRPPFGARDERVDEVAHGLGVLTVLWNADSGDASEASTPPSRRIYEHLLENVHAGSIVLLHEDETVPRTIDALRLLLPALRRRGLKAVTVPELLRLDPPVREEIANGAGGCNSTWEP